MKTLSTLAITALVSIVATSAAVAQDNNDGNDKNPPKNPQEEKKADDKKADRKAKRANKNKKPKKGKNYGSFDVIDKESNGSINEFEFLKKFANPKKGATEAEQAKAKAQFKKLDADGSGLVSKAEFEKIAEVMEAKPATPKEPAKNDK